MVAEEGLLNDGRANTGGKAFLYGDQHALCPWFLNQSTSAICKEYFDLVCMLRDCNGGLAADHSSRISLFPFRFTVIS